MGPTRYHWNRVGVLYYAHCWFDPDTAPREDIFSTVPLPNGDVLSSSLSRAGTGRVESRGLGAHIICLSPYACDVHVVTWVYPPASCESRDSHVYESLCTAGRRAPSDFRISEIQTGVPDSDRHQLKLRGSEGCRVPTL